LRFRLGEDPGSEGNPGEITPMGNERRGSVSDIEKSPTDVALERRRRKPTSRATAAKKAALGGSCSLCEPVSRRAGKNFELFDKQLAKPGSWANNSP
jgi:hypothetical protein